MTDHYNQDVSTASIFSSLFLAILPKWLLLLKSPLDGIQGPHNIDEC